MTDPSLNRRLDHHARRSGFAVGASMAVAIVLLIGAFVWLFATINPYLSDFLGAEAVPTGVPTVTAGRAAPQITPTPSPAAPTATVAVTPTVAPSAAPSAAPSLAPSASDGAGAFQADYRILPQGQSVNFRSIAGTSGSETLAVLNPGTPLQSTGEEQTVDGVVWLEFRNQEGTTGWIREIDTETV